MKFIIRCSSSNEFYDGDCQYALVEVDQATAKTIFERRKAFLSLHEKDKDTYELVFWDSYAQFGSLRDEDLVDDEWVAVEKGPESFDVQRTECDQMHISERGVFWSCYPRHADVAIETRYLPYEELEKLL